MSRRRVVASGSVLARKRNFVLAIGALFSGGVLIAGCLGSPEPSPDSEGTAEESLAHIPSLPPFPPPVSADRSDRPDSPPPRGCFGECARWQRSIDQVRQQLPRRERFARGRFGGSREKRDAIVALYDQLESFSRLDPRDTSSARESARGLEAALRRAVRAVGGRHGRHGGRGGRGGRGPESVNPPIEVMSFGEECLETCGDFADDCLDNASQANIPVCAVIFLTCVSIC